MLRRATWITVCQHSFWDILFSRKVFLTPGRSIHEIPSPRIKPLEGSQYYIRMALWGPRHDLIQRPEEPTRLQLSEADILVSTAKRPRESHDVGPDHFKRISDILFRYGLYPQEIHNNPGLFSMRPDDVEDRLEIFKECGWECFTADMIVFIGIILNKRSAKQVIGSENFSVTRSVLRGLLEELDISEEAQQEALDSVTDISANYLTLADCRTLALREFFRTIYPDTADLQQLLNALLKANVQFRPVKSWKKQFKLLLDEFKIPPKRILKYPDVVRKSSRHFTEILEKHPCFHGIDIRLISSTFPIVTLASVKHMEEMEKIFQKYGITTFQVARQLPVIVLSCETLEKRLQFLQKDAHLWKFHTSPDFLPLVIKFGDAMRRISFLRSMNVHNFGLSLLICTRPQFHLALNRGAFRGPGSTVKPQHLVPLADWLKMPLTEVRQRLRQQISKDEIGYFASDHKEMEGVLKCLLEYSITPDQLKECLSISLYPAYLVRRHLEDSLSDPTIAIKRHQVNFLHYPLYAIEKQTTFRGPAAWLQKDIDELEEEEQPIPLIDVRNTISQSMSDKLGFDSAGHPKTFDSVKKDDWFE